MVTNTKAAIASLTTLILGLGIGFSISYAIYSNHKTDSEREDEEDTKLVDWQNTEDANSADIEHDVVDLKTFKQKMQEYHFEIIEDIKDEKNREIKWAEISSEISKSLEVEVGKNELKQYCKKNMNSNYTGDNWKNLKSTIKNCAVLVTFKGRAKQLGIKMVGEENTRDERNKSWQEKFSKIDKKVLQDVADYTSAIIFGWNKGALSPTDLKNFCEKVGSLNWTQINEANSTKKEFNNYLSVCAKEENINRHFWKGENDDKTTSKND